MGIGMVCAGAVLTALLCTASVPAATLFVDSVFGGDSTHFVSIQSAFAAAGSNDTIYVRGGRTFAGLPMLWTGAKNGVRLFGGWNGDEADPLGNHTISPNAPGCLSATNAARFPESVWVGGIFVSIGDASQSGLSLDGVTVRGFHFRTSGGAVTLDARGSMIRSNVDLSCNIFDNVPGQPINFQQAAGTNVGLLFEGNRFINWNNTPNKTAIIFYAGDPHSVSNVTILDSYFFQSPTNEASVTRVLNLDGLNNLVIAGNEICGGSSFAVQAFQNDNLVMADNVISNGGVGINLAPRGTDPRGNVSGVLIAINRFKDHDGPAVNMGLAAANGSGRTQDFFTNIRIRHNRFEQDAGRFSNSTVRSVVALRAANDTPNMVNGPYVFDNNEIAISGIATPPPADQPPEVKAIRIDGDVPSVSEGQVLAMRQNVLTCSGATGTFVGVEIEDYQVTSFTNPPPSAYGAISDLNLQGSSNAISGFSCGVRVAHRANVPFTLANYLPTNADVRFTSCSFVSNGVGVDAGTNGPIDVTGSRFTDSGPNTNVTGAAGGGSAPRGRDTGYAAFRGDFNMDDAVDGADRLVWSNRFGSSGPSVTYFQGDATLDHQVGAADLLVWKRHEGLGPAESASAAIPTNPPAVPVVWYEPTVGRLSIEGRGSGAWAFLITGLTPGMRAESHSEQQLGPNWLFCVFTNLDARQRLEFVDGSAGGSPSPGPQTTVAQLPRRLTDSAFGPVQYFVGSNVFTTAVTIVRPSALVIFR